MGADAGVGVWVFCVLVLWRRFWVRCVSVWFCCVGVGGGRCDLCVAVACVVCGWTLVRERANKTSAVPRGTPVPAAASPGKHGARGQVT